MIRLRVVVEGETEEAFVKDVLESHLRPLEFDTRPILVQTSRARAGRKQGGGGASFQLYDNDVRRVLDQDPNAIVTTMVDLYRIPSDFPGQLLFDAATGAQRAESVEAAWAARRSSIRFLPYVQVHEFEALVFVGLHLLYDIVEDAKPEAIEDLTRQLDAAGGPEDVNRGPATAPSKRLESALPRYHKRVDGPLVVGDVGITEARRRCPHFARWITRLEAYAAE